VGKILLFYKYVDIKYPKQIEKWQRQLANDLGLTGRVILATEGINATLGGTDENTERYKAIMSDHPLFGGIDFKESEGGSDNFPRLRIVIKNEIVNLGIQPEDLKAQDGGKHLTPAQAHAMLTNRPQDLVVLDGRNAYESRIGEFTDSIKPPIKNFRDFPAYIDNNAELFKDKQVLMHCTGGIRCERASAYLKQKGIAKEVYQIEGGIQRYTEQFPDGYFRGKNYVFDNRVAVKINDDILGTCDICEQPYDEYTNCMNAACNKHFIGCPACVKRLNDCCSIVCHELVARKEVAVRPRFARAKQ